MMKTILFPFLAMCMVVGFLSGCASTSDSPAGHDHAMALCGKCGEFKGTDACCNSEGREICSKCDMYKGSPACCKVPAEFTGELTVCSKCGEIKGLDVCCKTEGREKCDTCGLLKGSVACCKLPKAEKQTAADIQ